MHFVYFGLTAIVLNQDKIFCEGEIDSSSISARKRFNSITFITSVMIDSSIAFCAYKICFDVL